VRIVTWNCNGVFRRKLEAVDALNADVLVIQECEDPAQSSGDYLKWAGDYLWTGYDKNKGIGIFPRKGQSVEPLDWPGKEYQLFLPARIDRIHSLIGVWTQNCKPATLSYIGQFWHFMQLNKGRFDLNTCILGDFNSNSRWDSEHATQSHTAAVERFRKLGMGSAYHEFSGEPQGAERHPTFWFRKNKRTVYHLDYAFLSRPLLSKLRNVVIGHSDDWLSSSDHAPVLLEIDL